MTATPKRPLFPRARVANFKLTEAELTLAKLLVQAGMSPHCAAALFDEDRSEKLRAHQKTRGQKRRAKARE